ncbi:MULTISPECIES: FtsW/RodA/SpoVE family cell cycle protein [unclassified Polaribacter]|jgi:cell division protein FtsW|uniref:FtsW/RodA/SpoVE family cell cycle protein n=1 Tax=unclassified Polaribacter TaxID=196858 RepID=UPI00052DC676|nr:MULTISPECIES: FtsW/RodA/SpoVE family cell cycle protein [unclassified Polaribacter]KGL61512.1 cell division protein FtsW [Polaribacter sp. Hel1_33_49]MBT4414051.1 FtsW/RodA/SpoVE family cell cycle protein [Polaribacter sp.]MDG1402565.1 FtsW/RodA/SpoVE family cell cycle protein [Polaribacter sp.]PKV65651.1 cell division protein FtsW [Polaribacter sp. Hel1_33_96]
MKTIFQHIKGDQTIWAIVAILAIFSFMPVYSASTNLVYVVGSGSTLGYLLKHMVLLIMGFGIIYGVHKIPYRYFSGGSVLMLPIVIVLLVFTLAQGTIIGGANASRWIRIAGIGFQTSTLAGLVLMVYVARYLAKNKEKEINFKESVWQLWVPVAAVLILILPANFSTTAIIFAMTLMLTFIGGYPLKYLGFIIGTGLVILLFFVLIAKAFPDAMPNRVQTWQNRIENFSDSEDKEAYQVQKAKIAIATGGPVGVGPGKSVQKNFLPQSSSDFIFAIIVEEYGLLGGFLIVFIYFLLLFRIFVVIRKTTTIFGTLLVVGVGCPIIFQATINMAVAANLFPVTGQTLPLISSGGTSIWMTCFALGMILSVSAAKEVEEEDILDDNPLDILHETI